MAAETKDRLSVQEMLSQLGVFLDTIPQAIASADEMDDTEFFDFFIGESGVYDDMHEDLKKAEAKGEMDEEEKRRFRELSKVFDERFASLLRFMS